MDFSEMDISHIELAHEYVLNAERICEYPAGRGSFGLVYVICGTAEYRFFSGERVKITDGEGLMLFPNAAYRITTDGNFCHYTVNFNLHNNINAGELYRKLAFSEQNVISRLSFEFVRAGVRARSGLSCAVRACSMRSFVCWSRKRTKERALAAADFCAPRCIWMSATHRILTLLRSRASQA